MSTPPRTRRIKLDGVAYERLEDIPEHVRARYPRVIKLLQIDRNDNGVPDMLEPGGEAMLAEYKRPAYKQEGDSVGTSASAADSLPQRTNTTTRNRYSSGRTPARAVQRHRLPVTIQRMPAGGHIKIVLMVIAAIAGIWLALHGSG